MKYLLSFILYFTLSAIIFGQSESWFANQINDIYFKGQREVSCQNGRADIVTNTHAIEIEFAKNWKNAIGQSLWYGLQLERQPGIVLVMKDVSERKYGIMLMSALQYAGIDNKIQVWFYPEDFGLSFSDVVDKSVKKSRDRYTYNTSSKIRHNSTCAYFQCKNCVDSDGSQGRACSRCGG